VAEAPSTLAASPSYILSEVISDIDRLSITGHIAAALSIALDYVELPEAAACLAELGDRLAAAAA
jgi:hypothetical protein